MSSTCFTLQRLLRMGSRVASPPCSHPFVYSNSQPRRLLFSPPTSTRIVDQERLQAQPCMGGQGFHKKPRILCLHGYRTSASILRKQLLDRWPKIVLEKLDLDFLDGPFPCRGKSEVEDFFDPPYFEWYHLGQDLREYKNYFEECIAYIEQYMFNHGPFDGLLGFSQGAIISAVVPGIQAQGEAFAKIPKVKSVMLISGAKFGAFHFGQPKLAANAFSSPLDCPSLHFIGETDFLNEGGMALLECFVDPAVIRHPKGHIIPRLDDKGLDTMLNFIEKIQKMQSVDQEQELVCHGG